MSLKFTKGMRQLAIRAAVFFLIVMGSYLFVFLYFRHTPFFRENLVIAGDFYFDFLTGLRKTDFMNAALFTAILFVIWNRSTLQRIKPYKQDYRQSAIFLGAAVLVQVLHYAFKYWVRHTPGVAGFSIAIALMKYLFNAAFIIFVALAAFNLAFMRKQYKKYRKQFPFFLVFMVVYFFIIQFFQLIWRVLSNFVASALYWMLNLTFDNVVMRPATTQGPVLGVNNFIVGISKECSGIDSLLLFLSLYSVLLVLDWNRINKKRMLLLLIPGIVGTIAYNLFRVYLIMLVGIFINPEFAIDVFHTNVGWLLFLGFFVLFWHFGSEWVYE